MLNHAKNILLLVSLVASIFFGCMSHKQATEVIEARARVEDARLEVKAAKAMAERAILAAEEHVAKKDTIVIRAAAHAEKGEYKQAYEEQKRATARLQAAVDTLEPALKRALAAGDKLDSSSGRLVESTKPSFWKSLVPELGIQATVGVDPFKPKEGPKAVVGIGVHWSF